MQISTVSEKIYTYTNSLANIIFYLLNSNEGTTYFINLCQINKDKLKMNPPIHLVNSDGFIINAFQVLLNCYFNTQTEYALEKVIFIEPDFFKIKELNCFEKINRESKVEELDVYGEYTNFLNETKAFYFAHILLRQALEGINKRNQHYIQQAQALSINPTSKEFKMVVTQLNSIYSIFKCNKFCSKLIQFLEITAYLCFTRNNQKYSWKMFQTKGKEHFSDFLSDFYYYIEDEESDAFNTIPELVVTNIAKTVKFLRESNPDIFSKNINTTKALVFFSLVFSSKTNIIKNPYIRAEALDIVEYLFIQQGKKEPNKLIQIFNDKLVREIFIYSLVRVFIDSERLGGSNQFYEKFNVRYKILLLIDSVKSQITIDDQLVFYAKNFKEDCILLVNYLINDLTYMGDETIERLKSIKIYEDLKADKATYDALSEEDKKQKEEKFQEDSSRCKNTIPFFKSYLQFMISISNTCQALILEYKLGQKTANLLNYLLNIFASKTGNMLRVSKLQEYKFEPKEFLSSIIQIYTAFINYKEFWTNIISDDRSFKMENFNRALNLRSKIRLDFQTGEDFVKLVNGLASIKENVTANIIDYEDAPDEFLDPITADVMEDPVMLPYSKNILDRQTIEQHLLSDPKDPFSRTPLDKANLIPVPELKEKIRLYKEEKMKKHNQIKK
jgi:ubiquitin conjugation factor E4 B